jgi:hypothetical protein
VVSSEGVDRAGVRRGRGRSRPRRRSRGQDGEGRRRRLRHRPAVGPPEAEDAVGAALGLEAVLVDGPVVVAAEEGQVRQRGGAAARPVPEVVALREARPAPGEAAAAVAVQERPGSGSGVEAGGTGRAMAGPPGVRGRECGHAGARGALYVRTLHRDSGGLSAPPGGRRGGPPPGFAGRGVDRPAGGLRGPLGGRPRAGVGRRPARAPEAVKRKVRGVQAGRAVVGGPAGGRAPTPRPDRSPPGGAAGGRGSRRGDRPDRRAERDGARRPDPDRDRALPVGRPRLRRPVVPCAARSAGAFRLPGAGSPASLPARFGTVGGR